MRYLSTTAVVVTVIACAKPLPPELDMSYEEADSRATEQFNSGYAESAQEAFSKAYLGGVLSCRLPNGEQVGMVLAVNESGRVDAVYVNPSTSATRCLQRALKRARLPEPPEAPFFHGVKATPNLNW